LGLELGLEFRAKPKKIAISKPDKQQNPFFSELTTIGDVRNPADIEKALQEKDAVVLLAAEHRDDVSPTSLYYDVNVQGTKNVLEAMDKAGVKNIIFTSSVAVYGLNKQNPNEEHPADPFNHYGKSKWQAEEVLREWYNQNPQEKSLTIIRPTVIFGERNRGNVYNLLKQIASGKFLMVGKGTNYKSMAYVGNIAAFIKYHLQNTKPGYQVFNYIDKPDLNMNELVSQVEKSLNKHIPSTHFPYWLGMLGGYGFDILGKLTGKKFSVSSVRVYPVE
jgi:nucleoside-diphosphate-sugar epimerase